MNAEGPNAGPGITTRRYTGTTRGDAEAGFKSDWRGISGGHILVAEGWDDATHTLTVVLKRLPSGGRADQDEDVRDPGESAAELPSQS